MQFYTTADIEQNRDDYSFDKMLSVVYPGGGSAPLLAMSGMAKTQMIKNTTHSWWTKTMYHPTVTTNGVTAIGGTSITVVDSSKVKVGSILRYHAASNNGTTVVNSTELVRVTAIPDATTLTVVRTIGGGTGVSIPSGAELVEVGSSFEQGSAAPSARSIGVSELTNRTQIFRDGYATTETLNAVQMRVGDGAVAENKRDAMHFHSSSIEQALFFGRKSSSIVNNKPMTTMDGLEAIITANAPQNVAVALDAGTSFEELSAYCDITLDYQMDGSTPNSRTLFCGKTAFTTINNIGRMSGEYQLVHGQTQFGLAFATFRTIRGTYSMIEHPMFNKVASTHATVFILDLPAVDVLWFRRTTNTPIAEDGVDAQSGVMTSELSLQLTNPLSCGIIYNLTKAKAS